MHADYSGGGGSSVDYRQFQNPYEKKKTYEAQKIKPAKPAGVRISFNTGVSWGLGFFGGSAYGIIDGLRTAVSPVWRVRLNSALNGASRYGSHYGNTLGSVVFLYTTSLYIIDEFKVETYSPILPEYVNSTLSGLSTGIVYKSTKGPRAALLAGCIGAVVSNIIFAVAPRLVQGKVSFERHSRY